MRKTPLHLVIVGREESLEGSVNLELQNPKLSFTGLNLEVIGATLSATGVSISLTNTSVNRYGASKTIALISKIQAIGLAFRASCINCQGGGADTLV